MARIPLLAFTAAVIVALATGSAGAVDATKPSPTTCAGLAYKDPGGDQANLQVPEGGTPPTEILNGFLKHDPSKGAEATTYNVTVKDLTTTVPAGYTTMSWNSYYTTSDDTIHFVRALVDFAGTTAFEYGVFTPNPTGAVLTGVSQYEGQTQGKLFEGPEGVVQVVIPAAHAKAGDKLTKLYSSSGQGRTLPASAPGFNRGLSAVMDTAPDAGADSTGNFTVAPCADDAGTVAPGTTTTSTATTDAPLPVKLAKKSAKLSKKQLKSKSYSIKLRSSEAITKLVAQLRKGKKRVGKGSLAKLDGTATLKLKLSAKLKKGSYALDVAGTDANGQRRVVTLSLKLK